MKLEKTEEDLTIIIGENEEKNLVQKIPNLYDDLEDARREQLDDIKLVRGAIYDKQVPEKGGWGEDINLPDIYELSQTLKSYLSENLYSHPEAMFDVSGVTLQSQACANKQKSMLVNTFNNMKLENELEKVVNSVVETGESTLFVGWETKIKRIRRPQTLEEQLTMPSEDGFVIEDKVVYDNAKVKFIKPEDFVFDKNGVDNWESCAKIYRSYVDVDELSTNKANNLLTAEKLETLKGVVAENKNQDDTEKAVKKKKVEVLEYWGDIELSTGEILKNRLVVIAGRHVVIRFEANPFIITPFVHANIIESPDTGRGISPLRVALVLNNISSTILNKQIDALALMMNPPYLAPKGCFKGEQAVKPGKIIEYDSALMPTPPTALSFTNALQGWEFLNYFKGTIESATGIYNNMSGNLQASERTATELTYSVNGQETRLNMMINAINRKLIVPMVEKTAEIISNFKLGNEVIAINDNGKTVFVEIDDSVRNAEYTYRYGDRNAVIDRKNKLKELFEVIASFAKVSTLSNQINWIECFKFALEQYGIENAENFLVAQQRVNIPPLFMQPQKFI
ncbi:hypothetical protein KBA27_05825 [bacterium]|nr:hypothetical protein [bacterium]